MRHDKWPSENHPAYEAAMRAKAQRLEQEEHEEIDDLAWLDDVFNVVGGALFFLTAVGLVLLVIIQLSMWVGR